MVRVRCCSPFRSRVTARMTRGGGSLVITPPKIVSNTDPLFSSARLTIVKGWHGSATLMFIAYRAMDDQVIRGLRDAGFEVTRLSPASPSG